MWYTGPFAEIRAKLYKCTINLIANCNPGATVKITLSSARPRSKLANPRLGLGLGQLIYSSARLGLG